MTVCSEVIDARRGKDVCVLDKQRALEAMKFKQYHGMVLTHKTPNFAFHLRKGQFSTSFSQGNISFTYHLARSKFKASRTQMVRHHVVRIKKDFLIGKVTT